jgi:hypothetical protein
MSKFCHIVEIDDVKKELIIYRLEPDSTKTLYTSIALPETNLADGVDEFRCFALQLGENILFDSPAIQKMYRF